MIQLKQLAEEKAKREGVDAITQRHIAEATGIPTGTLSRWWRNKVDRLDVHIIERLCVYFECEVGDLIKIRRGQQS